MSPSIIQHSPRPLITIESSERQHDTIVSTCCGEIYLKRLFLPFTCLGFLFLLNETHTFIYTPLIIFFIFLLFFGIIHLLLFLLILNRYIMKIYLLIHPMLKQLKLIIKYVFDLKNILNGH